MALRKNTQFSHSSFEALNCNHFSECVSIIEIVSLQKHGKNKMIEKFCLPVNGKIPLWGETKVKKQFRSTLTHALSNPLSLVHKKGSDFYR